MIHKRLHHVGIILPKEEYVRELMDMYGLESETEGMTPYDTKFIFTKMNPAESESPIEFLIPYSGVLAEYNGGKGGIAHICFQVEMWKLPVLSSAKKVILFWRNPARW